jgi:hypothetical protein
MTVKELIATLTEMPQDSIVVVHGYEGGVYESNDATIKTIALNVHTSEYLGNHEETEEDEIPRYPNTAKAVLIS